MIQPCPVPPSKCFPCDPPTTNLTAENPDSIQFYGSSYNSQDPIVNPVNGQTFQTVGCQSVCTSTISQSDADLCAQRQQIFCNTGTWKGPPVGGPPPIFLNNAQVCDATCPDGLQFAFTVPAGTFAALSQALADRMAFSYACRQARLKRFCLPTLSPVACKGQSFSVSITASGPVITPCTWQIVAGVLPPGLTLGGFSPNIDTTLGPTETIQGTPTQSGSFTFTLQCAGQDGSFMQKQYTICIASIVPNPLPGGNVGVAYSQQLSDSSGCLGSGIAWSLASGLLPTGLSLSASGLISGIPTNIGSSGFTVTGTLAMGSCQQHYVLSIGGVTGCTQFSNTFLTQLLAQYNPGGSFSGMVTVAYPNGFTGGNASGIVIVPVSGGKTITLTIQNLTNAYRWQITWLWSGDGILRTATANGTAGGVDTGVLPGIMVGQTQSYTWLAGQTPTGMSNTFTLTECVDPWPAGPLQLDATTLATLNAFAVACGNPSFTGVLTRDNSDPFNLPNYKQFLGVNLDLELKFGSAFLVPSFRLFLNYVTGGFCIPVTSSNIRNPNDTSNPRGTYQNFSGPNVGTPTIT